MNIALLSCGFPRMGFRDGVQILWAQVCICPRISPSQDQKRTLTNDCQAGSPNLLCIYLGSGSATHVDSHSNPFNATFKLF